MARMPLIVLLIVYGVVASLFAILTPAWQAPDEPAHYNYARQLAERRRCCPVIAPGDWDQAYLSQLTSARFAPDLLADLPRIQYEDHQPPLYYQMVSLVYGWTEGSLIAMRLFSVLLGLGVVWCAYAMGRELLPDRPGVALGAAALVALLPQHVAMLSAVNNDSLTELLIGLTLLLTARHLLGTLTQHRRLLVALLVISLLGVSLLLIGHRIPSWVGAAFLGLLAVGAVPGILPHDEARANWLLGMLLGLIFATKITGYPLALVVALAVFFRWRLEQPRPHWRVLARRLAWVAIPALVLGGLWWLRNISTYGFPDFLGLGAHDQVVADQMRTAARIAEIGFSAYFIEALRTTYYSFWGQFGWMALPLQGWMYTLLSVLPLAALGGLVIEARLPADPRQPQRRALWWLLGLTILLNVLAFLYYNLEFLQLQGRYLFPALIPLSLFVALGLDGWRRWLLPRAAWAQWLPPALIGLLALLDVYLILRVIRPLLLP